MQFLVKIFRHKWSDGRSKPQTRLESGSVCDKVKYNTKEKRETNHFYMETLNWEKPQKGGELIIIRRLHEWKELFVRVFVLGLTERKNDLEVPFLLEEKVYLCLTNLCILERMIRAWSARADLL